MFRETINTAALLDCALKALPLLKENQCSRLLIDLRNAALDATLPNLYTLIPKIKEGAHAHGLRIQAIRQACLTNENNRNALSFYEMAAINNGQSVKVFDSLEEASEWLKRKE